MNTGSHWKLILVALILIALGTCAELTQPQHCVCDDDITRGA